MRKTKGNKVSFQPEKMIPEGFNLKSPKSKTVRATFTLSSEAIMALEELKKKHGITFGKLINKLWGSLMPLIINSARELNPKSLHLAVRKAIVISGEAQKELKKVSEKNKIPRDVLVDKGIIMMKLLVEEMEKRSKKNHKRASETIGKFWSEAEKIEKTLQEFLDPEDPILERFGMIIVIISNLHMAIEQELEKGIPISPDDFSQNS
jgi:hypothetical protein